MSTLFFARGRSLDLRKSSEFSLGRRGLEAIMVWSLKNGENLLLPLGSKSQKVFSFRGGKGGLPPDPLTRGSALNPAGGSPTDPVIGSCSALSLGVSTPHFFHLATPLFE